MNNHYDKIISDKVRDTSLSKKLIDFVSMSQRFGFEFVRDIYPDDIFNNYIEYINNLGLSKDLKVKNDLTDDFLKNIRKVSGINIDWLKYFAIFAEIGNTNEASQKLNVTPQAIVKAISGIEESLKINLVRRKKNQFKGLTNEGKIFLDHIRVILQNFYNMDKRFSDIKDNPEMFGKISIAHSYFWNDFLPDIIASFLKKYPKIEISLFQVNYRKIEKWLSIGEIDIGLLSMPNQIKDINYLKLLESPYIIAHKNQNQKFEELSYIHISSIDSKDLTDNFLEEQYKCKKAIFASSVPMAIKMAEKGVGAVWIPEIIVLNQLKSNSLYKVEDIPPYHGGYIRPLAEFFVAWNKNIYMNRICNEFIKHVKEETKDMNIYSY